MAKGKKRGLIKNIKTMISDYKWNRNIDKGTKLVSLRDPRERTLYVIKGKRDD